MKVAICGAGQMGQVHFDTFSRLADSQVVAIADPVPERLGRFSEKGAATFTDADVMLDEVGADVAVVATPTAFHAPLSIKALEKGMHVFCEKPMARSVAEGEAMIRAAEKAGKTLGIGYVLRYHDAYRMARDHILSGKLGAIGTVRTSRCAQKAGAWTADLAANGGVTFELLSHDLDWLAWSLGPVKRIFARGLAKGRERVERDYCLAVVRFANGAIGHLEASLAEAQEFYASYEVAGDAGLLSYDTRRSAVIEARLLTAEGLRTSSETPQGERPFARQVRTFVKAVSTGADYEVDGAEALEALRLTEAAYESIQTGEPVEV